MKKIAASLLAIMITGSFTFSTGTFAKSTKHELSKPTKQTSDKLVMKETSIDGVKVVFQLPENQEITKEKIGRAEKFINHEKLDAMKRSKNSVGGTVLQKQLATLDSGGQNIPLPGEGDGHQYGPTKYWGWSNNTWDEVESITKNGIFTIASAVGSYLGPRGAVVVGAFARASADHIEFKREWSTEKLWEYYKASTGEYMLNCYQTVYSDSARTKVVTVIMSNDVFRNGSYIN